MPAGKPWLQRDPRFQVLPKGTRGHVVYDAKFGPPEVSTFTGNPFSTARFALAETHAMFYVGEAPATALWEVVLRDVEPDAQGRVLIPPNLYRRKRLVEVELKEDRPLLILARPQLLQLFPKQDSPEVLAVEKLLSERDHAKTHPDARQLHDELQAKGYSMPTLMWPSRQTNFNRVYLTYSQPGEPTPWQAVSESVALDSPDGFTIIQGACQAAGFRWIALATAGGAET